LFNSFDPSPFLDKDLDDDAVEYIVESAKELPKQKRLRLSMYLPEEQKKSVQENDIRVAIKGYFKYTAHMYQKSISKQFKEGYIDLGLGLLVLVSCLLIREVFLFRFSGLPIEFLAEGFLIGGWVAMWKPISTIIYDWRPLRRQKQLYQKLSTMLVRFVYEGEKKTILPLVGKTAIPSTQNA